MPLLLLSSKNTILWNHSPSVNSHSNYFIFGSSSIFRSQATPTGFQISQINEIRFVFSHDSISKFADNDNDDGYDTLYTNTLFKFLRDETCHNIKIVAPKWAHSGKGGAIDLFISNIKEGNPEPDVFYLDSTPVQRPTSN